MFGMSEHKYPDIIIPIASAKTERVIRRSDNEIILYEYLCHKKHGQLTISQSVTIRVSFVNVVNNCMNFHLYQPIKNQWDSICTSDFLYHHKPPVSGFMKILSDYVRNV